MTIKLIVAMSKNRVIGKDRGVPWHIPDELKLFKKITMGHTLLMGRKTYDSIGRPLPGRKNVVATRDNTFQAEGITIYHSLKTALEDHVGEDLFIIGGEDVFTQTISIADEIYLTTIDETIEGDRYFPEFNEADFEVKERRHFEGPLPYEWVHYRKRRT